MSNKYLEKLAGRVSNAKHLGRAALSVAKQNPMTVAFGAGGAMDGALSTTHDGKEGPVRFGLRGARNTIVGGAKGAAAGKALELGYKHLKERAGN
jgi:hypothetical protein